ncbi:hypothetical protein BDP27DRAFT_1414596 [Rhodocollybia butyracea]|uniref:serine--tRNA ligase n=1 Tax=Rhodocollybia butyracea TaxID=206335 RepID=A0A9P5Q895_9AGAR|nr:hypothetical protein BDP27DRAFT_1414596 [Rhodocollybia butyracea]
MSARARLSTFLRSCSTRCYSSSSSRDNYVPGSSRNSAELLPPRPNYRKISENFVYGTTNAINRKASLPPDAIEHVSRLYKEFNSLSSSINAKRNARSILGESIADQTDPVAKEAALKEGKVLKEEIAELEATCSRVESELRDLALQIPNDTHPASPLGPESAAVTLATHGPACIPASPTRDHLTVARKLNLVDLESAAIVTGNSWYYLTNEGALLELALTNYAISVAVKRGFKPVTTPDVVRSEVAQRCGFKPRDQVHPHLTQSYHLHSNSPASRELILAGTAEVPLAGMFTNNLLKSSVLPLKIVGSGHAFRAEAGARGAETRGLYRVHQFTKIELFAVTAAEGSEQMMEEMREVQESILNGLDIPFRILDMPTEELGASAYRKYDIEAWMPGRGRWGEVSSLSNCTDYQARRLHIRMRGQLGNPFVHTLNGTAAAIPRLIVALIENGVEFDDAGEPVAVVLPEVLKPFWIGDLQNTVVKWKT